ncbi:GTP-binding protein [Aquibacillus halophilus]|uniref:GTP-binding protein n=1 Tax=Aquibacillus halophilus TaxID=930132 RepID=A0A6A8DI48_9BACI|nr:dynamin family protein [Aquibacillus halophilus]MRH42587.1 GTP-binding protein [Aquibacillus halophilus]
MGTSVSNAVTVDNIAAVYQEFKKEDNQINAEKTLDLFKKIENNEFVICFSGHFSAGKSSLINRLLGEDILPQSPIPTSANVVKITSGKGYVRVYFDKEDPTEYVEPYDLETIKEYCKDGDSIKRIEISKRTAAIPSNVSILDTPGIDSSNDADRIMTESSLHMVDALFYVMDYNHVQSDVNLRFLRKMQQQEKSIYIVINQIDKHQEKEIPFLDFKKSVEETFQAWGINPQKIYFTSLVDNQHYLNQFEKLESDLQHLMKNNQQAIEQTVEISMYTLIDEHIDGLRDLNQTKKDELRKKLVDLKDKQMDGTTVEKHKEELERLKNLEHNATQDFRSGLNSTLKNAYIMPFELRELAEQFLQSQHPGFKLGIFSTKKKIDIEKKQRLDRFYHSFMEVVKTNIEWKLRDKLLELTKKYNINDSEISRRIHSLSVNYSDERLKEIIKPGAVLTGEYLLVYTEDLANDIKSKFKQACVNIWESVQVYLKKEANKEISIINSELNNSEAIENIEKQINQMDKDLEDRRNHLHNLLLSKVNSTNNNVAIMRDEIVRLNQLEGIKQEKVLKVDSKKEIRDKSSENNQVKTKNNHIPIEKVLKKITESTEIIKDIPGFKVIEQDLIHKKDRLTNRRYTIALFGAFSAGKSSFANALIGEKVLPVSPNPTTATINKISPINKDYKHGTVVVKVKSQERILMDISEITNEPIASDMTLNDYLQALNNQEKLKQFDHKHQSFLIALVNGHQQMAKNIGQQIVIELEQFPDFVTEEHLACYVEWMELFYDCPLTRKGITLVDTPGADSINARHTDVSFEYIKQADAILFVTYYNHAFSKADRDFLVQLGRVKDAFSLDKMFFVVNAADLAKDNKELKLVTDYVTNQLVNFGIRFPRMYPISSKNAILEKNNVDKQINSGITKFEDDFYHFIQEELMEILITSTLNDIKKANKLLKSYINSAHLNNDEKSVMIEEYKAQESIVIDEINKVDRNPFEKEIKQKIDKQLFYVNHRLSIQFSDYFKESFNPSTIKANNGSAKLQLEKCLEELIKNIGSELAQELRAVSLRIELFMNVKSTEFNQALLTKSNEIDKNLSLSEVEEITFDTPTFKNALVKMDLSVFDKALSMFKNTKSFFEKNEKEDMKVELFNILTPYVEAYLKEKKELVITNYISQWEQLTEDIKNKAKSSVNQYYDGLKHLLSNDINVEELENASQELERVNS